jgi:hypothetical protein
MSFKKIVKLSFLFQFSYRISQRYLVLMSPIKKINILNGAMHILVQIQSRLI